LLFTEQVALVRVHLLLGRHTASSLPSREIYCGNEEHYYTYVVPFVLQLCVFISKAIVFVGYLLSLRVLKVK